MNIKPLYIFDLDGTLALIEHRRHFVECPIIECIHCGGSGDRSEGSRYSVYLKCNSCSGKGKRKDPDFKPNWKAFYEACIDDVPNMPVITTMLTLWNSLESDIWIWSARSDVVRLQTEHWLCEKADLYSDEMKVVRMRNADDYTPDEQLKEQWLKGMSAEDRARLVGVFDDRNKVVDMYRRNGITVFQVAPGNF